MLFKYSKEVIMKAYGLPTNINETNPHESLIELFGLKNGCSEEKRNAANKRAIRKSMKHSERFQSKQKIISTIYDLGY